MLSDIGGAIFALGAILGDGGSTSAAESLDDGVTRSVGTAIRVALADTDIGKAKARSAALAGRIGVARFDTDISAAEGVGEAL